MRARAFWLGGALAAASCSGMSSSQGGSTVRIETDRAEYGHGSQVLVRFTNASADVVSYNGCVGLVERRTGSQWSNVGPASDVPCRDYLAGLQPGEFAISTLTIPPTLPGGLYRYRFSAVYGPEEILLPESERVTNSFRVIVRD